MDRNELKVQALLEKISSLTANYENQVADLRVEITLVTAELEAVRAELGEYRVYDIEDEDVSPEADKDRD